MDDYVLASKLADTKQGTEHAGINISIGHHSYFKGFVTLRKEENVFFLNQIGTGYQTSLASPYYYAPLRITNIVSK